MICNDPFLTYLKSFGYNVVRLPRTNFRPLQVLARQGNDLSVLGELATLFITGTVPPPQIRENSPAASISGQRTSDFGIGIGLSIMDSIISAMGGSKIGLDTKYSQAKSAAFEFQDVCEDSIEVLKLDQYLADADVNPLSHHAANLLESDDLFVTTAVIKSAKFIVEAKKKDGTLLDISIPELQGVVGGSVRVSGAETVTSRVTYESSVPLVFGFQAMRLFYDQGRYTTFKTLAAGDLGMRGVPSDDGTEPLVAEGAFVRLSDL